MRRFVFGKTMRLVANDEFKAVIAHRQRVCDGVLTLYVAKNDRAAPRLGISIAKAAGTAPVRNRIKRLLREVFRLNINEVPAGFDYVVLAARQACASSDYESIKSSFLTLVAHAKAK